MALDLIKEYLVGIGFEVDKSSLDNSEKSMDKANKKVEEFNNNSKKGFSETGNSLKDLFSLVSSSGSTLGKIFPELRLPFKELVRDITEVKKSYDKLSNIKEPKKQGKSSNTKKDKEETLGKKEKKDIKNSTKLKNENNTNKLKDLFKDSKELKQSSGVLKEVTNLKGVSKSLALEGGAAIKTFAATSVGALALVGVAVAAIGIGITKIGKYIGNLAKQDIEFEKLARQLWTTKENARDIDMALKTLGASMEDIKLSPTLLKQFNTLRKDAAQLRMPPEFKDNIKVVQGIGLEFKRLKQFIKLFFQLVGSYILKYCAGPLAEIKKGLNKFNTGLLKAIPVIAKVIGTVLGVLLRSLLTIGRVLAIPFKIINKIIGFIIGLINKIPEPIKKILKILMIIAAFIVTGPIGAIILVIGLIDDLFTFLKGGKSIIGSVFDYFKNAGKGAIDSITSKFGSLKESFKSGMDTLKDDWNNYLDKASKVLDAIKEKAKGVWGDIKEWSKGLWEKTKGFTSDIVSKIEVFNKDTSKSNAPASYVTSSVTTKANTTNNNNEVKNSNVINVYGADAKSNANEVDRKLSGVTIRALQGVT